MQRINYKLHVSFRLMHRRSVLVSNGSLGALSYTELYHCHLKKNPLTKLENCPRGCGGFSRMELPRGDCAVPNF